MTVKTNSASHDRTFIIPISNSTNNAGVEKDGKETARGLTK